MNEYYIVMVQDFGETYEYCYPTLEAAQRFMEIERLLCSLWFCKADGTRTQLAVQKAS